MNRDVYYQDVRYNHYKSFYLDQYGGDAMVQLLPSKHEHFKLTKHNSILVNPVSGNFIGNIKLDDLDIRGIIQDLRNIECDYGKHIFQLVSLNGVVYLNPYFKQPNKLLTKEFLTSGSFTIREKEILDVIKKMQCNVSIKAPNYSTICIVKKAEPVTKIMGECIDYNNPIYLVDDYIEIVRKSPFWIYVQKD